MSRIFRRSVALPVLTFVVAASALAATASPAVADNASTLTVVGTSDVFDSNLVQAVIKPGFESQYPGVTLNYVSKGTGAAIQYAEAGTASAMIVHAASLENQFVDQGYSLEDYGRAIFWGDYVLLGPANDPAKVMSGAGHDIATAFEKIALAGKRGKANFVSRGGTPGTTVQEHAIWSLTNGVPVCQVDPVNGGGEAPSTTTGTCPLTPTNPSWYHTTGLTQGPNIVNGDACNYTGGGCYVFTDRGTFQYLKSQGSISNLQILVRNNQDSRRGGRSVLVNSFHAYAVNPDKFSGDPNVSINVAAATNFLNWITSTPAQSAIGAYLANVAPGAPFIPDAAPNVSTPRLKPSIAGGTAVKISGVVSNVVPGALPLSDVQVTLTYTPTVAPARPVVFQTPTGSDGSYSFSYKPPASGTYTVSTPPIQKIENPDLRPVFGDLLASTTKTLGPVAVQGVVALSNVTGRSGVVTGTATISPVPKFQAGSLQLYAAQGAGALQPVSTPVKIPIGGSSTVSFSFPLAPGTYQIQVHYVNPGVITEGLSDVVTPVTVS